MRSFGLTRKALVALSLFSFFCSYSVAVVGQASAVDASQRANPPSVTPQQSATPPAPAATGTEKDTGNAKGAKGKDAPSDGYTDPTSIGDAETAPKTAPVEDWNTLAIPSELLVPAPAPPLKVSTPKYTREFIQLIWRPRDIINLYVIKPVGVAKPPVIVYLYSFPTDTSRFKQDEFDQTVTENGFAAVGFVSALTGERFHDRPMKEWFVSDLQEALGSSVHDVQLILNYLTKRGDLDMTRVGMFGDGSGASIAILSAATDPRIQAVDLFDAWGDWPDWLAHSSLIQLEDERADYLKPEFLKTVENLDPVKYLPQLTKQKVRLQYLKSDHVTPDAAKTRVLAAAPASATIVQYESQKDFMAEMITSKKIFDWIQQQVVTPTVAAQETEPKSTTQPLAADKASDR
jgi:dienelactone hydrolase